MDLADESSAAAYAQRSEAGGSPSLQRRAAPGSPLIGRMRASDELPLGDGSPRSRRRLLERTFAYLGLTLAWLYWNAQGTESSVRYGAGRMRKLFAFPFLLLTNQYVLLLAYVYWPTHIYLFKEQGQTPSATVAMMRPPATLQP